MSLTESLKSPQYGDWIQRYWQAAVHNEGVHGVFSPRAWAAIITAFALLPISLLFRLIESIVPGVAATLGVVVDGLWLILGGTALTLGVIATLEQHIDRPFSIRDSGYALLRGVIYNDKHSSAKVFDSRGRAGVLLLLVILPTALVVRAIQLIPVSGTQQVTIVVENIGGIIGWGGLLLIGFSAVQSVLIRVFR